ncbi:hypothetical protein [Microbacterium saperdae]|uniref:Uncharacterized protein n=1 Tax=Microbacterium saperdae TaxID=69368 RepID=A0A543BAR9_9MICO|nr:hypothetical protein [Microbacterium saperdae]TQL81896.1 hypothetical protein FB560_3377 [Microbacterium saperdae]GGM35581.1 hypothetical protein GCM10010489_03110 [Microbacterium saperdae]
MNDQRSAQSQIGDNLAWVSLFVAVVSALVVLARTLEIAGCSNQCDYPTPETITRGFWITDLIVFILTTSAYFFTRSRLRLAWLLPAAGITITLIALLITNLVMNSAMRLG